MFDTMTLTKAVGAICGTFLVFLLGGWAAETIYHVGSGGHGYSEEKTYGYKIEVEDAGDQIPQEDAPTFAELLAVADISRGERAYGRCKACHALEDGKNGTGPHLFGLVGRDIGSVEGYGYSSALAEAPGVWTPEELDPWLENPGNYAPGTKMNLKLSKPEDRANLIAYLATIGG